MNGKKLLCLGMAAIFTVVSTLQSNVLAQNTPVFIGEGEENIQEISGNGLEEENTQEISGNGLEEENLAAETDYEWEETAAGTVQITKYNGTDTEVIIPAQINGKNVTRIEGRAFAYCSLTSIELPKSLEVIGDSASFILETETERESILLCRIL